MFRGYLAPLLLPATYVVGNNISRVYVCVCVHLCVGVSVQIISFEPLNSSCAEPKITQCTQCQYLQNCNCAEMSKIAAHLKIGTHLPFNLVYVLSQK